MKKNYRKNSLLSFYGILLCLWLLIGCGEHAPKIESINPRIGRMGDVLTIRGNGFGEERNGSFITIAGASPTSSSYLSWNDGEISIMIPEFGEAGLVYVHRGKKRSNPVLFANLLTLPESVNGSEIVNGPNIRLINPASASVGSLITIQGNNFGSSREQSGVFFDSIEVFEAESGYELWNDREIRVRVPDGAVSGNLELRTPSGNSLPVPFEITGSPGTKEFKDKKVYTISFAADIQIEQARPPNTLYIWMPQPALSASQRNVRLLSRSVNPFVENYRGTSLFRFNDCYPRTNFDITLSYAVDVYAVETSIGTTTPARINRPSVVGTVSLLPSSLIPSEDPTIRTQLREIIGNERQPYPRAQRIYNWLISSIKTGLGPLSGGGAREADSISASLLFCALARAADIPAQPVAGVLVNSRGNATKHYWAEFWLDGFGWIPLDPALGAGSQPPDFVLPEDPAKYYFGNLDNQRIAFSRGEHSISRMTPKGQVARRSREYSLQTIWEEAIGGIESYSSRWSDVTIININVQ